MAVPVSRKLNDIPRGYWESFAYKRAAAGEKVEGCCNTPAEIYEEKATSKARVIENRGCRAAGPSVSELELAVGVRDQTWTAHTADLVLPHICVLYLFASSSFFSVAPT
jgi:hypothetical protein